MELQKDGNVEGAKSKIEPHLSDPELFQGNVYTQSQAGCRKPFTGTTQTFGCI